MFEDLFCERLTKLRLSKGVSAREMSLSIGQSPGYINNLENKKNFPTMGNFFYICHYLGVTPSEFFDSDNAAPKLLNDLISDLKHLDANQLANVSAIVKGLRK